LLLPVALDVIAILSPTFTGDALLKLTCKLRDCALIDIDLLLKKLINIKNRIKK
jgi:hypothetical protein